MFHRWDREAWRTHVRVARGGQTAVYPTGSRIRELEQDGCVGEVIFPDHQNSNEPPFGVIEDSPSTAGLRDYRAGR